MNTDAPAPPERRSVRIVWRGVTLEVRHTQNWLRTGLDHIEIEATPRTPLPITETGYRSHFIEPRDLADYEDAADLVRFWLDRAGKDWGGQLSLF